MTSPFLTLSEVAAYLRYDLDGPDGAKQKASLVKWLAKYGCRPSLKRGLYRLVQIEAAVERLDLAQGRRRQRGFQSHASRFEQSSGSLHGAGVSGELVTKSHGESVGDGAIPHQSNSVVGAR